MYVWTFFNMKIENMLYLSRKICYWQHENFQIYNIWYKYFEILLVRRGLRTRIRTRTKVVPQQHPTSTVINFKRSKSFWSATCFSFPSKRKKETAALFAHSCWVCCDNLVAIGITSAFSHTPRSHAPRATVADWQTASKEWLLTELHSHWTQHFKERCDYTYQGFTPAKPNHALPACITIILHHHFTATRISTIMSEALCSLVIREGLAPSTGCLPIILAPYPIFTQAVVKQLCLYSPAL